MTPFQKLLRIENKLAKHCFRNMDMKSRTEPINHYLAEGVKERQIKKMGKKNYDNNVRECGNVRSKFKGAI